MSVLEEENNPCDFTTDNHIYKYMFRALKRALTWTLYFVWAGKKENKDYRDSALQMLFASSISVCVCVSECMCVSIFKLHGSSSSSSSRLLTPLSVSPRDFAPAQEHSRSVCPGTCSFPLLQRWKNLLECEEQSMPKRSRSWRFLFLFPWMRYFDVVRRRHRD